MKGFGFVKQGVLGFFYSLLRILWSGVVYFIVCVRDKKWKRWDQGDGDVGEGHHSKSIKGSTFSFGKDG